MHVCRSVLMYYENNTDLSSCTIEQIYISSFQKLIYCSVSKAINKCSVYREEKQNNGSGFFVNRLSGVVLTITRVFKCLLLLAKRNIRHARINSVDLTFLFKCLAT